jgi:Rhs element Vgr protein
MADSPENKSDGVLSLSISCGGQSELQEKVQIVSVTIRRGINAIPWARVVIADGDMPTQTFPTSDESWFAPGAVMVIKAGYNNTTTQVFRGVVVKHSVTISGNNFSRLTVECRHQATKMTIGRNNANYVDQSDSDVISALIGDSTLGASFTADVKTTSLKHKELVRYYCTAWDFMLARAEANGLLVIAQDNESDGIISVQAPDTASAAALSVEWGMDIMDFHADIDARTQYTAAQATSWSLSQQAIVQGDSASAASSGIPGNLYGDALAKVASPATFVLQTSAPQEQAMLTSWAKAAQLKAELARVRGHVSFQGHAAALPGTVLEIAGVGARFSGKVYLSAVQHELRDGNWTTQAEFGLDPRWFTERDDAEAPSAAGLLPGVSGLQIGVVMKLDGDPENEQKIQVKVPVLQAATAGVWARLLQFHGSSGFGAFFVPEVGDEVVLGYFNDDPCHPVILGSLYSSARQPAYAIEAKNNTKAIVTRCLHKIEFNEEDKIITITTPGGNEVVLDDKNKCVLLQDQNGNTVKLSDSGIALDSPKDIKLTAKGGITLTATQSVEINAKADVKLAGLNVSCKAQTGFTAQGTATAELSASGQTTVKGAMVMIN